ncbi:MAG: hypothetical protein GX565_14135 [Lentisphaerae bacterium]|jgi:hypothetical protein|nr:hypothetical protein [Lentisphaerota bacterium]
MADEAKGVAGVGVDERVKSLEEALSVEKAKNEVLMEQILKAENGLAEAVSAFASPQDAMSATLSAMVKKFGWASATNTLVTAAESCADGSFSEKDSASVKQVGP